MNNIEEKIATLYNKAIKDIESEQSPSKRAELRFQAIELLAKLENLGMFVFTNGVDSIKEDTAKENNVVDITSKQQNTTIQQTQEVIYGIDIKTGETLNLDVTEAYNILNNVQVNEGEDITIIKRDIATAITNWNVLEIFKCLKNVTDCYDKALLASFIAEFGMDNISTILKEFNSGLDFNIYDFVNDSNLDAILDFLFDNEEDFKKRFNIN